MKLRADYKMNNEKQSFQHTEYTLQAESSEWAPIGQNNSQLDALFLLSCDYGFALGYKSPLTLRSLSDASHFDGEYNFCALLINIETSSP